MPKNKYEYSRRSSDCVVPVLQLKKGSSGIINCVGLYEYGDAIYSQSARNPRARQCLIVNHMKESCPFFYLRWKVKTLRDLSPYFGLIEIYYNFPKDELEQLLQLEDELEINIPDYRERVATNQEATK